ncbi:DUF397 domain-containing protein [Micromonospora sp. RTP1Z1]|uniref:DUF397 domain-containing protein n=1 Tax=Micromonospora sp. RTP1Z1 TaxID=2994043 RepID=UPI0029C68A4C|nr:DUF397 domain-containing protein [Micromonospora sp. RTP1Z1]
MNEIRNSPAGLAQELADATWRTSTRSQTSNCVEVAPLRTGPAAVALRDSKDRGGPVLLFNRADWLGFIAGAKSGRFDLT